MAFGDVVGGVVADAVVKFGEYKRCFVYEKEKEWASEAHD